MVASPYFDVTVAHNQGGKVQLFTEYKLTRWLSVALFIEVIPTGIALTFL